MPAEARVTTIWKNQRLIVSILFLFFGAYFLFDGLVTYPRLNKIYHQYHAYDPEGAKLDANLSEEDKEKAKTEGKLKWEEHAKRENWDVVPPEKEHKEIEQFIFAGFTGIIGVIAILYWLSQKGRVLRTTETEVHTPGGKVVPLSAITGLGKKKWESKGFATVRYEINGQQGQFLLDDYKFEPKATHQVLDEIEKHLLSRSAPVAASDEE